MSQYTLATGRAADHYQVVDAHLNTASNAGTGLCYHLNGQCQKWAIVADFSDNTTKIVDEYAIQINLNDEFTNQYPDRVHFMLSEREERVDGESTLRVYTITVRLVCEFKDAAGIERLLVSKMNILWAKFQRECIFLYTIFVVLHSFEGMEIWNAKNYNLRLLWHF